MSRLLRFAPLAVLALLLAAMVWRLATPADTNVASRLVGKPLPDVALGARTPNEPAVRLKTLTGQPMILNVFGSWCVPCIAEAPVLSELRKRGAPIVGIAVRDTPDAVTQFVTDHGNPYRFIGMDPESRVQIALGSSGVPESFVVDSRGIIRYQHIGPIEPGDIPLIMAKLEEAR